MTTAESDAVALLVRIRDSVGDVPGQWEQVKALLERICKRVYYGGWPSRQLKELVRKIDAADTTGVFGGVGTQGCRDITALLVQIRDSGVVTAGGGTPPPPILDVTNAQKLALTGISAGQEVRISDAFVVSGFGDVRDAFYFWDTDSGQYVKSLPLLGDGSDCYVHVVSRHWVVESDALGVETASTEDDVNPWEATWPTAVFVYPALQVYLGGTISDEASWGVAP
jgi:hypothetical protein